MHRFALDYLQQWMRRASRKPLVVRGARQVGKSHLVRRLTVATARHCSWMWGSSAEVVG